ncbi:flavodoxin family protein, partial [Mycobacteroides abscessus subsp. massiliense]
MRALSLVCSLKRTGENSSTEILTNQVAEVLSHDGVHCES